MRQTRTMRDTIRRLNADEKGAAAVEFGMIIPFVFFALVAMVDFGQVAGERIDMDHVVRAGTESAMVNADEDAILKVLESTASESFTLESESQDGNTYNAGTDNPLSLWVNKFCECPEAPGVEASCSNACANDVPPDVYVDVNASKLFSGMIIPDFRLDTESRVRLR